MIHTFRKSIRPKVNVIARQEFEITYFEFSVQRFSHNVIFFLFFFFSYFAVCFIFVGKFESCVLRTKRQRSLVLNFYKNNVQFLVNCHF